MTDKHRVQFSTNAREFMLDDTSDACLVHGGRGSLKSHSTWGKVVSRARHPGAIEGCYRKRLIDFKDKELPLLLDGIPGLVPPILQPGTYSHNQSLKRIEIKGGGSIVYNGFDQGDVSRQAGSTGKSSGGNLTGAAIFEVVEITEQDFDGLDAAVRIAHPVINNQINCNCNPGPPAHWVAKRWGLALDHKPRERYKAWHMDPRDNPWVTAKHLRTLNAMTGVARQRYLEGKWVGSDGMVYDQWDRLVHVVPHGSWEPARHVWVGVDEGYTDPFVVIRLEVDARGNITITDEVYQPGLQREAQIDRLRPLAAEATHVVVDSSAPQLVEAVNLAGIHAEGAAKGAGSVEAGIREVQQLLAKVKLGEPGLRVSENCTNTIREFETYEWKAGADGLKDTPIDRDNHAMDSIRYAVTRGLARASFGFYDTSTGTWVS